MQQEDKALFNDYEIKNWNYSPRLYKILGGAAVLNLLAIFVMGQTDMLTTRGCDSPMVSRVCQVIDTIYIGSTLLGTDSEYVSKDYENTVIEDADITYIDVSGADVPLSYPAGYFALANPESQFTAMNDLSDFSSNPSSIPGIPGFPSNSTISNGADLMNTPQVTPTPNNNAITGIVPDKPFDFGDANPIGPNPVPASKYAGRNKTPRMNFPRQPKTKNNSSPKILPPLPGETTADKDKEPKQEDLKSDPVAEVEINKKPFEDLGDTVNEGLAKKEIDLNKPFLVVMDGVISEDGKLDPTKSKFVKAEGDEKMREVARQAIEAVGNSGFLHYLKKAGVDKVNFTIVQDDKQINVIIVSEQKDNNKAKTTVSSFNTVLEGLKLADRQGWTKLDENSKTLIDNSKITSKGKNFVLNFGLSKQTANDIITKTLKERAEKRAVLQPKSSVDTNSNSKAVSVK